MTAARDWARLAAAAAIVGTLGSSERAYGFDPAARDRRRAQREAADRFGAEQAQAAVDRRARRNAKRAKHATPTPLAAGCPMTAAANARRAEC